MTTAVTTTGGNDLRSIIQSEKYKQQFAMAMPKHMTADRMVRVALTALTKQPKLMECTQASVMSCLLDCASLGLEPDGRRAHLIPFKDTCTLIIDYKGLAELALRSGLVSSIHADIVCEHDQYEENMGRVVKHVINRKGDRGEMYAAYSHVVMKDGTDSFEIMSKSEIEAIRKRSRAANNGPWVTDFNEMAKKTVFRRHSKWLPLSPEFRDALDKDADVPVDITGSVEIMPPAAPPVSTGKGKKLSRKIEEKEAPPPQEREPGEDEGEEPEAPPEASAKPAKEAPKKGLKKLEDMDKWHPGE